MERLYAGYYVAEMLRLLTDDHQPHAAVYDLTVETLQQIDSDGNVASALACFDTQLLRMLGHGPGTDRCTDCGSELPKTQRIAFSLIGGGLVCNACKNKQRQSISVSRGAVEELRRIQSPELSLPTLVDKAYYGELRAVMNRYIQTLVGSVPRMQHFLPNSI